MYTVHFIKYIFLPLFLHIFLSAQIARWDFENAKIDTQKTKNGAEKKLYHKNACAKWIVHEISFSSFVVPW